MKQDFCESRCVHPERIEPARAAIPPDAFVRALSGFYKVFGDPTRLRILSALSSGELCVCDLASALGMSDSAVSHQLARLRDRDLVASRREGKTVFYSLADDHVATILDVASAHVAEGGRA